MHFCMSDLGGLSGVGGMGGLCGLGCLAGLGGRLVCRSGVDVLICHEC